MKFYYLIILFVLLYSCGRGDSNNTILTNNETPKALKDKKIDFGSYRGYEDLTELLYQELVNNSPELKNLENDIEDINPKFNILQNNFKVYDNKSNSYYISTKNMASEISDSLLRNKIIEIITKSNNKYNNNTNELNTLLLQISKNDEILNNHHLALKILLTLPVIEKFQKDHIPNKTEFMDFIKDQDNIILKIDSLSPKH